MARATKPKRSKESVDHASRADASVAGLKRTFLEHLFYTQGRFIQGASFKDAYMALAYTVRDQLLHRWVKTVGKYLEQGIKVVSYLSAEFLLGPHLENNLINLGLYEEARKAVEDAGFDFQKLVEQEEEPGLGNGGLGRLAACYLDSLATCEIPAIGYGIRYEFGIFDQLIRDGWQVEQTDHWLCWGNP